MFRFGVSTFKNYSRQGWQQIIDDLCLKGNQTVDGILNSPMKVVENLHKALIKDLKKKK